MLTWARAQCLLTCLDRSPRWQIATHRHRLQRLAVSVTIKTLLSVSYSPALDRNITYMFSINR